MLMRLAIGIALVLSTCGATALAQNTNSSTTMRPRTTASPSNTNKSVDASGEAPQPSTPKPAAARTEAKPKVAARAATADTPGSQSVVAAFNDLIDGIERSDAKAVSNVYWNSPRLMLFNNNGTVTKGWQQMRSNRESYYKDVKDVKLDVRDISITMLGRDGAVVTSQWTQSQTYKGTPETSTGRMTLIFKRVGKDWKAIHLHTSPDKPDPSRVLPSEQTPVPSPTP